MNYSLVKTTFTYVEVKDNPDTAAAARKLGYGINLAASEGCINLVIPERVSSKLAISSAKMFGFEPTGVTSFH